MIHLSFISKSPEDTVKWGAALAKRMKPGDIVCLSGDLGAGKTTLVKGIAQGLKVDPAKVTSPTFVLMNMYEGRLPLYHFDLYRMDEPSQIANIGYEEFLYGKGVAVVEWAQKLNELYPVEHLKIELEHKGPAERLVRVEAHGKRYDTLLMDLSK